MDNRDAFNSLLAEFGTKLGKTLNLDENDSCAIIVDGEVVVNIQYLHIPEMVLLWSTVGILPEDEFSGDRALYLLEKQDFWQGTKGFTLGLDAEERRLLCHDIRNVTLFESIDLLAAWIDSLVEITKSIRNEIAERYPSQDDFDDALELNSEEEDADNAIR